MGRFLTQDRAESNNEYIYCNSNPVNMTDPNGKKATTVTYRGWSAVKKLAFMIGHIGVDVGAIFVLGAAIITAGATTGIGGALLAGTLAPELLVSIAQAGVNITNLISAIIFTILYKKFTVTTYTTGKNKAIDSLFSFAVVEN